MAKVLLRSVLLYPACRIVSITGTGFCRIFPKKMQNSGQPIWGLSAVLHFQFIYKSGYPWACLSIMSFTFISRI